MYATRLAAFLLYLIDSAELQARAPQRFFASQAGALVLLNLLLEMKVQLVIQFGFGRVSTEQGAETKEQITQHGEIS